MKEKKETKKYLYISGSVRKPLEMRFLLPRQVTLAARRRKKFSPGREQMWTPQPPVGGERRKEKCFRNNFTISRVVKNTGKCGFCYY